MDNKTNINWYPGHMAKTKRLIKENLNLIDVVYEVIDARIPFSSKIIDIDEIVKNKPKILIMSKMDLCDLSKTNQWVKYYESKGYNVILTDLEHNKNINKIISLTEEITKDKFLKNQEKGMINRRIRALIIGIPNVGKSTLINRLVSKKVTNTGNKPGVTKNLNWIRVNQKIELLDTPGILWPKLDEKKSLNLASLTAIKEEILPIYDVAEYILRTLEKKYPNILEERYKINHVEEDLIETLEIIGKKFGCIVKGGVVDYDKVISLIINDIKLGIIKNITFDDISEYE